MMLISQAWGVDEMTYACPNVVFLLLNTPGLKPQAAQKSEGVSSFPKAAWPECGRVGFPSLLHFQRHLWSPM